MYKRIIVKVGTKVLSTESGVLDRAVVRRLVEQVVGVKNMGVEVVLVTSGAVGTGKGMLTLAIEEKAAEKQVFAAVGQVKLMSTYAELFGREKQLCAQVLATKEDFRDRHHYLNMRTCLENLLKSGVVPVVNENDVVATTELLFTDNDELAGLVASQLNADAVVILTSVEGFLTGDPRDATSCVVPEIDFNRIVSYKKYVVPDKTALGRGGMLTKFGIAQKLTLQGITVHLANGRSENVLVNIVRGARIGTTFLPRRRSSALKRRIAYSEGLAKGSIVVNACTEELLCSKTKVMSLLPVGVVAVSGEFGRGDIIELLGEKNKKLGFGIAAYGAAKARELAGVKGARALVHYDHMFIGA